MNVTSNMGLVTVCFIICCHTHTHTLNICVESGLRDYGYMICFCADGEANDDAADNAPAYDGAATGNGKRTFLLVAWLLLHGHSTPVGWVSVLVCVCVCVCVYDPGNLLQWPV